MHREDERVPMPLPDTCLKLLEIRDRRPDNTRYGYATAICRRHDTDLVHDTTRAQHRDDPDNVREMDGEQNALGMARLESTLSSPSCPSQSKTGAEAPVLLMHSLGWLMGLEPTTTGITILDSTN